MRIKILVSLFLLPMMALAQESSETSTTVEAEAVQQEAEQETSTPRSEGVEKIEVTGSYIRRTDVEGPSPVLVIDRQAIEKSGFNSVGQILQRSTVAPFGGGSGSVSLKGIGSGRTLILINGQRAPGGGSSYSGATVSVNFVPIAAVDRIEILKDGASATYGSDALGGVVNIITRKDIDGFSFANQYDMTTNNGSDLNRTALAYGKQTAKSNLMTSVQVQYTQGSRTSDFRFLESLNQSFPFSTNYNVNDTKDFTGLNASPNCTRTNSIGWCEEAVSPRQVTLPSLDVDTVTQYSRNLSANTTFYTSLITGFRRGQGTFPNVLNTPGDTIGLLIQPGDVPPSFNSLPNLNPGDSVRLYHRFDDYVNKSTDLNYYGGLVLGTKGYFGDSDWEWDATLNNQVNIAETHEENLATVSGARAAIEGGTYDPFNPNVRDTSALGIDAFNRNTAVVHWAEAKTNGPLGSLLGLDWSSAFGVSVAHFSYSDNRAADIINDNVMLQSGVIGRAGRELYSAFTEFSGLLGKNFELQFSLRGDMYSDFGETVNPKLAARYQPAKWLTFRVSGGTGFQAPTLQNMNATIQGYNFLVDQKLCRDPSFGNNDPDSPFCLTQSTAITQNPNPDLQEETSISLNFGTIIQPTKSFQASIDWWYVKVEDTIGVRLRDILQLEADGVDVTQYNVDVVRPGGPNSQISRINYQLYNVGREEVNGIDLDMEYKLKTTAGDWTFRNETTYLNHYLTQFYAEFGNEQVLGQFERPRWRNNFTLSYEIGKFESQVVARSIADVERNVRGQGKIVSPTQYDLALAYDFDEYGDLQFGIRNIGNVLPRFDTTLGPRVSGALFQRVETYYLTYRTDF